MLKLNYSIYIILFEFLVYLFWSIKREVFGFVYDRYRNNLLFMLFFDIEVEIRGGKFIVTFLCLMLG